MSNRRRNERLVRALAIAGIGLLVGVATGLGIGVLLEDLMMGAGIGLALGAGIGGVPAALLYGGDIDL